MSAHDYVSRWFENDLVKAKFMFWATIGGNVGPYSPGTAFYLVTHLIGQTGMSFCKGGMGSIADAIAASGAAHGMEIRCDSWVDEILVRDGNAVGVRLRTGEELHASRVISNINVKRTFLDLVDESHLPEEFVDDVKGFRSRGMGFKLLLAVDRLPQYKGFSKEKTGTEYPAYVHICPTPRISRTGLSRCKIRLVLLRARFFPRTCPAIRTRRWRPTASTSSSSRAA